MQCWPELGCARPSPGLAAPRLVVADGAPGLISAVEEIWPRADRQHCAVHRLRNLQAKLPKSEHDRIRFNYWSALTDATSVKDGKQASRRRAYPASINLSQVTMWRARPRGLVAALDPATNPRRAQRV